MEAKPIKSTHELTNEKEVYINRIKCNLGHDPLHSKVKSTKMKYQDSRHFSHDHFLLSLKINNDEEARQGIHCDACKEKITAEKEEKPFFHGCRKCDYHLHDRCFRAPRSIQHQSHPLHPLSLLSIPTYSSRSYLCDACGDEGNGEFSYGCAHCGFDIHLKCALLFPPSGIFNVIHPHELTLKFDKNDCGRIKSSCDVCDGGLRENLWLYYCGECEFAVHLDCVNGPKDDEEEDKEEVEEKEDQEDDDEKKVEEKEDQEEDDDDEAKTEEDDDSDDSSEGNDDEEEALMRERNRSLRQRIRTLIKLHKK
ncbi:OLC1v1001682C1 [Oldenlandia corymbosa var. corymbosa]|uniref:OLC1v1001682C1 n=1 Tax=Oldenlandia corymbosa var. corymbosa TaxID=529605 RepID=A0AAV1D6J4_OLDCO|nr:OLC1v1001682C1 [Oldenlandia corymbosa var. corymbosa]